VEGNFSLTVTDENQVIHENFPENIQTYLLLSSESAEITATERPAIKGPIEQPGYYFDAANTQAALDLDVLLMTQGWRRFLWNDVLYAPLLDTTHAIEQGLRFSGKITFRNGKPPAKPVPLIFMLSSQDGESQFIQGTSSPDGTFFSDYLNFTGPTVIAGSTQGDEKKIRFIFDSLGQQPVPTLKAPETAGWIENSIVKNYWLRLQDNGQAQLTRTKMLKDVVVKGKKIETVDSRRNIAPEVRKSNMIVIDPSICAGALNVFQMMQSKVPGVRIYKDDAGGYHAILRTANTFLQSPDPLYLVDGFPVDATALNFLVPCDVESIEVFKGPVAEFGSRGNSGAIAIYTRKAGPDETVEKGTGRKGLAQLLRKGYDAPRQFYSPQYEPASPAAGPDHRSTVYWQPYVVTDKQGKATVSFWMSDEGETDIRIILQGMSYDGKPVTATFTRPIR
jgi:hypothetical protein